MLVIYMFNQREIVCLKCLFSHFILYAVLLLVLKMLKMVCSYLW